MGTFDTAGGDRNSIDAGCGRLESFLVGLVAGRLPAGIASPSRSGRSAGSRLGLRHLATSLRRRVVDAAACRRGRAGAVKWDDAPPMTWLRLAPKPPMRTDGCLRARDPRSIQGSCRAASHDMKEREPRFCTRPATQSWRAAEPEPGPWFLSRRRYLDPSFDKREDSVLRERPAAAQTLRPTAGTSDQPAGP